jgi:hypothetical protein
MFKFEVPSPPPFDYSVSQFEILGVRINLSSCYRDSSVLLLHLHNTLQTL